MKFFLSILMLVPILAGAQDCVVKKETDQFTREPKLSTGFIALKLAEMSIDANKKEFDFFFTVNGQDRCFDDNSTAVLIFEGNRQKSNFRNSGSMNCEGLFHFTVKNGPETPFVMKRLSTQKVTQIIFTGNSKKEIILTLTPAQQELLMKTAGCIATESKAVFK